MVRGYARSFAEGKTMSHDDCARQVLKDIDEALARGKRAQEKWRRYGIDGAVRAWERHKRWWAEEERRKRELMW